MIIWFLSFFFLPLLSNQKGILTSATECVHLSWDLPSKKGITNAHGLVWNIMFMILEHFIFVLCHSFHHWFRGWLFWSSDIYIWLLSEHHSHCNIWYFFFAGGEWCDRVFPYLGERPTTRRLPAGENAG